MLLERIAWPRRVSFNVKSRSYLRDVSRVISVLYFSLFFFFFFFWPGCDLDVVPVILIHHTTAHPRLLPRRISTTRARVIKLEFARGRLTFSSSIATIAAYFLPLFFFYLFSFCFITAGRDEIALTLNSVGFFDLTSIENIKTLLILWTPCVRLIGCVGVCTSFRSLTVYRICFWEFCVGSLTTFVVYQMKDVVRSCYEIVDLKLLRWLTDVILWVFFQSIVI